MKIDKLNSGGGLDIFTPCGDKIQIAIVGNERIIEVRTDADEKIKIIPKKKQRISRKRRKKHRST